MTPEICAKEYCTGCGVCVAVCPKKCITLKSNPQGHLFPHIDTQFCVNCNLCRKTCPTNTPAPLHQPQACYAAWAQDEKDRTTSSSGAASSVFASHIIGIGGIVYGAALQDNKIQHIRVTQKEDLRRLKGSKYVYSYAADVYAQIKEDLATGKTVLFTGTPCQNTAVYNLVGENPNLILVNLICHGVPSMQMLTEYLKSKNITKIQKIQFRNNNNNMYEFVCNDYNAFKKLLPNTYMTLFLSGITYRSSCYRCAYAQPQRIGDLTIGDFWGLGEKSPFEQTDLTKGCSVVIVNTTKGKNLLNACQDKLQLFEREYQEAINGNGQLRSPYPYKRSAKMFNKFYPKFSFKWAALCSSMPVLLFAWIKLLVKKYGSKQVQQSCLHFYQYFKKGV